MKKSLILLVCCLAFGACTHEKEAQELYSKATGMKLNAQYSEAIPLYKEVISKYPRSSVISSATSDLAFCEKRVLEQKIEHNTPIILKAVDNFPARKFPAIPEGTMPLGKSISAIERTACNVARNYAQKQPYYSEGRLVANFLAEGMCDYTIGKWNITSQDNAVYTASKTRTGQALNGETVKTNYTYIVDIKNNTIAAQDHTSCFVMSKVATELFGKEAEKIAVDYTKECAFPIKLEGVLK